MDKITIIELEKLIFQIKKKPEGAARMMADIIGVLIGVKPVALGIVDSDEIPELRTRIQLKEYLEKLGLKALFFGRNGFDIDGPEWRENIFISKELKIAVQAHETFEQLWQTMDNLGQIFAPNEWRVATKKIGRLLGYPETAVDAFADNRENIVSEEHIRRIDRNRYYVHSAEHEEQEYYEYDYKINQAISELAPQATQVLTSNKAKRWL